MSEMTDADVLSALQEAAAQDVAAEQAAPVTQPSPPAPEEGAPVEGAQPQVDDQAPVQSVEDGGVEQSQDDDEFVPFNPDELPEELLPAWKQMQRAFTPRLQEAAAIRKRFEELGGQETVEQAVGLYQRIADPQQWPALYEELYQAMQAAGFEFEDFDVPPSPTPSQTPFGDVADDPDLAPIISELEQLRGRTAEQQTLLEQLYEEQAIRQQMADEELRQAQYLAQMQRQVVGIRQSNPHYDDEDIKAIIEIGSFYGDDLATAQQRYEDIVSRRLDRYFESKKAGAPPAVTPPAGAGVLSDPDTRPETLEEAEAQAVELMRRLQAEGALDDF